MLLLVHLVIANEHEPLVERLLRTATSFLEAQSASVERTEVGAFRRASRRSGSDDLLRLVRFTSEDKTEDSKRAHALETVLRSTAVAAGVKDADVRVFVERSS